MEPTVEASLSTIVQEGTEKVAIGVQEASEHKKTSRKVSRRRDSAGLAQPVRRILKKAYATRLPQVKPLVSKGAVEIYEAHAREILLSVGEKAFELSRLAKKRTIGERAVLSALKFLRLDDEAGDAFEKGSYANRGLEFPEAKVKLLLKNGRLVRVSTGAAIRASRAVQEFVQARATEAVWVATGSRGGPRPTLLRSDALIAIKAASMSVAKRDSMAEIYQTRDAKNSSDQSSTKKTKKRASVLLTLLVAPHPYFRARRV